MTSIRQTGEGRPGRSHFLDRPAPFETTAASSACRMVVRVAARCTDRSETQLEDDMPALSDQRHSPQESRRRPTPLPPWNRAIVLSNRACQPERGADGLVGPGRSSGGLVAARDPSRDAILPEHRRARDISSPPRSADRPRRSNGPISLRESHHTPQVYRAVPGKQISMRWSVFATG